mmetsp:Transcript_6079/g.23636  ORF Transcript_6079/g.23636 Transcript_6079/m.23636 type:complete len:220 (+) Transcript_6079:1551-2210(+)|eukprot:scaffold1452_cov236-Pinguiococcus_pyrenoidosus.AAC.9
MDLAELVAQMQRVMQRRRSGHRLRGCVPHVAQPESQGLQVFVGEVALLQQAAVVQSARAAADSIGLEVGRHEEIRAPLLPDDGAVDEDAALHISIVSLDLRGHAAHHQSVKPGPVLRDYKGDLGHLDVRVGEVRAKGVQCSRHHQTQLPFRVVQSACQPKVHGRHVDDDSLGRSASVRVLEELHAGLKHGGVDGLLPAEGAISGLRSSRRKDPRRATPL